MREVKIGFNHAGKISNRLFRQVFVTSVTDTI